MKENAFKLLFAAALGGVCAYLQQIIVPLAVLIAVMVVDYITGLAEAHNSGTLNSRIGINGIFKKLGYIIAVGVGMVVDYIIYSAAAQAGITFSATCCFGLIVTIWLIVNELISILENLAEIGVPLPEFLRKIVEKLKITIESKTKETDNKD